MKKKLLLFASVCLIAFGVVAAINKSKTPAKALAQVVLYWNGTAFQDTPPTDPFPGCAGEDVYCRVTIVRTDSNAPIDGDDLEAIESGLIDHSLYNPGLDGEGDLSTPTIQPSFGTHTYNVYIEEKA